MYIGSQMVITEYQFMWRDNESESRLLIHVCLLNSIYNQVRDQVCMFNYFSFNALMVAGANYRCHSMSKTALGNKHCCHMISRFSQ